MASCWPLSGDDCGKRANGFATNQSRALLTYLALTGGVAHGRNHLAAMFWPEAEIKLARTSLRNTLYRLRKALNDVEPLAADQLLTVTRQSVQFNDDAATIDVLTLVKPAAFALDMNHIRNSWSSLPCATIRAS